MNKGNRSCPDDGVGNPQDEKNAGTSDEDCYGSDGEENAEGRSLNPWTRAKVHKGTDIVAYLNLIWPHSALKNVNKPTHLKEGRYFKKSRTWEKLQFNENDRRLLNIVSAIEQRRPWLHSSGKWTKEIQRYRSVVTDQPCSLLGELIKEGCWKKIRFVLKYFSFDKDSLNLLQVDETECHLTEFLVRNKKFKLLFLLVKKYNLKLSGKWKRGFYYRRFSAVLTALEFGDDPSRLLTLWKKFEVIPGLKNLLSACDELGRTPLSFAVINENQRMVETLLDLKAPVNQSGWGGDTALAIGMQMGTSLNILSLLLKARAEVDTPDSTGVAPRTRSIYRYIHKT